MLRSVKSSVPVSMCVLWMVDCVLDCVDCRFFLLVVSDCFSQRHDNSRSMRSCQRRRVGFFRGLVS